MDPQVVEALVKNIWKHQGFAIWDDSNFDMNDPIEPICHPAFDAQSMFSNARCEKRKQTQNIMWPVGFESVWDWQQEEQEERQQEEQKEEPELQQQQQQ